MSSESRTTLALRAAKYSVILTVVSLLISFISRRLFLDSLGTDVMGLRTTLGGLISALGLAELGIGTVIAVFLYKPLYEQDHQTVNEVLSLQGWLYRNVAIFVVGGILVLSFFLPSLFANERFPLWYAYLILATSIISTILSYTINYKTIVITADQRGYKMSKYTVPLTLSKSLISMVILAYVEEPFLYMTMSEFSISLLIIYLNDRIVKKDYPWLQVNISKGREYLKKYPIILKRTGQIFFTNVSILCLQYTTPLVVWSIVSLSMVGGYENYRNLIANIRTITLFPYGNLGPGVGNLIAEGNEKKIYSFFWETQASKYFIAAVACFGIYCFATPFISLWLGEQYKFSYLAVLVLTITAYIDFCRGGVDSYLIGYSLFSDIWAPIAEGILNIGCSIALGYLWGFEGVLMGYTISLLFIVVLWKPYFLFSRAFKRSIGEYWKGVIGYIIPTWGLIILFDYGIKEMVQPRLDTYPSFFLNVGWITLLFALLLSVVFYSLSPAFRSVCIRAWQLLPIAKK